MADNVLKLFEGLNRQQAKALNVLALPVLGELRKALVSGEPRLVIDLQSIPQATKARRSEQAQREKSDNGG